MAEITKGGSFPVKGGGANYAGNFIGCGWDKMPSGPAADVDLHILGLSKGKVVMTHCVSWFNTPDKNGQLGFDAATGSFFAKDGSITINKDNRDGEGEGDDEKGMIHLDKLPAEIDELLFVVDIYEGAKNGQDFGKIKNAYVRVVEGADENGKELVKYKLTEDFPGKTCIQVGNLTRPAAGATTWVFEAQGIAFNSTIQQVVESLK